MYVLIQFMHVYAYLPATQSTVPMLRQLCMCVIIYMDMHLNQVYIHKGSFYKHVCMCLNIKEPIILYYTNI